VSTTLLTLNIEGLAYGGDAFGRADDGRMIFVPHAAPNERITCRLVEEHKRWAKAELVEILNAHPRRIEPPCPHYGSCGGCHYQFLPYEVQVEEKGQIVRSQLERIGKMTQPPLHPMIPSPSPWHMRNHIQFHQGPDGTLGFHRSGSKQVMPITTCLLPMQPIDDLWPRVTLDRLDSVERIGFRCDTQGDVMVVFQSHDVADVEMSMDTGASVAWVSPSGTEILGGGAHLRFQVFEQDFVVSPASFFQVNTSLIERMMEETFRFLDVQPGQFVLDLYAGVGLFSAFAAARGAAVTGVESAPSSCSDYALNLDSYHEIELYQAKVGEVLPSINRPIDAVILDPPRAGLAPAVRDALIANKPKRMVYLSCDTATFARDARRLTDGGFHCVGIQPLDMFPQTSHIELLSYWE